MADGPDPLLRDVIGRLREPVSLGDAPIERALTIAAHAERARRRWRPVYRVAALAAMLVLAVFGIERLHRPAAHEGVTFALRAPEAGRVAIIGDFNGWDPSANPLHRQDHEWAVTLRLKPGRYRYSYVVDGSTWRADPRTPSADDDFGTPTSVITVAN